jgi:hypothetical protein
MSKPQKIIEIKGSDWLHGTSSKVSYPWGGLYQELLGCDIFDDPGIAKPSLAATQVTSGISTTPKILSSWNDGSGNGFIYAHSDSKLYKITKDSPYTVTDVTAQITTRTNGILGAIMWQGMYVYIPASAGTTDIRANSLPVASGSDIALKTSFLQSSSLDTIPMCIGADKNLYVGNSGRVDQITNSAGTSGNTVTFSIDTNWVVRDMCNDGRYLVIIADNNAQASANRVVGDYKCRIYFWDMVNTTADVIYEIHGDSYMIAGRVVDGAVYLFGYNGFYVCNSATPPSLIRSFLGSTTTFPARPMNSYQVTEGRGSVYWIDGGSTVALQGTIYAYGNPIAGQPKAFYQPYSNGGPSAGKQICLSMVGEQFWNAESGTPSIYVNNSALTYSQLGFKSLDYQLPQPYKFEYAKVVLAQPLSSGQTVTFHAETDKGNTPVSTSDTKTFNSAAPHRELVFTRKMTAGAKSSFESLNVSIETTGGVSISRISIYGTALDDNYQNN